MISAWAVFGMFVMFLIVFWRGVWRGFRLGGKARALLRAVEYERVRKDEAYTERNVVAAFMAAVVLRDFGHETGWRIYRGYDPHFKGWETCLYIEPPPHYGVGQMCWHYSAVDKWLVDALAPPMHPTGWDKRTREEKYESMSRFVRLSGMDTEHMH